MPTIKELLEVPFGPWEDSEVLNPKLKTTVLRTLELYELDMSCDDQPIGLNESERYGDDATRLGPRAGIPIYFRGVFEIQDVWKDLSDTGRENLNREIIKRAPRAGLHSLPQNFRLRIQITGRKHMTVRFLMGGRWIPDGLVFQSADQRRFYEVKSMCSATYKLSRKYLIRFDFRRALEDILDADLEAPPVEERGMAYFLDHIVAQLDAENEDFPDPIAEEFDEEYVQRGVVVGLLGQARHLPVKSRADVNNFFATHGRWLLRQQNTIRTSEKRLFDPEKWAHALRKLRQARDRARTAGTPWSMNESSDSEEDIAVAPRRRYIKRPAVVRGSVPDVQNSDDMVDIDSDVSEPSTPSYSSSDSDRDPGPPTDPEILSLVPRWGTDHAPPPLWADDRRWHCPQRDCAHAIDFADLDEGERAALQRVDREGVAYLDRRLWYWGEPRILHMLKILVDKHWKEHLADAGIERKYVKGRRGKKTWVRYQWIQPELHRQWPPEEAVVKEELQDD